VGAEGDLSARHAHQVAAGERLGAGTAASGEYDVVIEAAGTESALVAAIDHARPGGTVSIPGVYWDGIAIPNVMSMFLKEVSLRPSSMYGCSGRHGPDVREVDEAAALLAAVPELSEADITHRFALDDAPEAFRVAADRSAGAIKVVLEP
jgi:threonine dehydrogenase-like Zn-dependent dehydrogenase